MMLRVVDARYDALMAITLMVTARARCGGYEMARQPRVQY